MKLCWIFSFLFLFYGSALGQNLLNHSIDFKVENRSLPEAIQQLQEQSGLPIAFSSHFFKDHPNVSLDLKGASVKQILKQLLTSTNIRYKLLNGQVVLFQKKEDIRQYTISGHLLDAPSGEKLVFATVYCSKYGKGTTSNEYGFYSLTLPPGEMELSFDYVGSESQSLRFSLQRDTQLSVALKPGVLLAEVIVENNEEHRGQSIGFESEGRIPLKFFDLIPGLAGENDVMRTAHLLPGVQTGADGSGGMYIRGGEAGQNLILLDGVPVYNPAHLLGIFSVFNSSAVRSVHLLKGGFPARYGGGISSVFDIRTREGSQKKWSADLGLGFLSGRLSLDGPILSDRLSVMLTARRSHSTFLFESAFKDAFFTLGEESKDIDFDFYDINTKFNYKLSKNDDLILSLYRGGDDYSGNAVLSIGEPADSLSLELQNLLKWGNQTVSLRWNHQYNKRLFSNTTLTYSDYQFNNRQLELGREKEIRDGEYAYFNIGSSIRDFAALVDFDYISSSGHRIRTGAGIRNQRNDLLLFVQDEQDLPLPIDQNGSVDLDFLDSRTDSVGLKYYNTELYAYVEDDFSINANWKANLGARLTANFTDDNRFLRAEPRLSTHYLFDKKWSMQASLTRMSQFLHKISFTPLQHPGDFWIPSVEGIKPQSSWQYGLGVNYQLNQQTHFSIETYYKKMKNLLTVGITGYEPFLTNEFLDDIGLVRGEGQTYGVELLMQQQGTKSGGWISYSLAWSKRQYPVENQGNQFSFQYDSRHQLKLFWYHHFSDHFQISGNWMYFSPVPLLVLDEGAISIQSLVDDFNEEGAFNKLRSSPYHRLDLNASYKFLTGPRFQHTLQFSLFNLYGRRNVFYHQSTFEPAGSGEPFAPIHLFGTLPSFQYNLKF